MLVPAGAAHPFVASLPMWHPRLTIHSDNRDKDKGMPDSRATVDTYSYNKRKILIDATDTVWTMSYKLRRSDTRPHI